MPTEELSLDELKAKLKEFVATKEYANAEEKEATLLLRSLSKPFVVTNVKCKECGEWFQTNYAYKAYCTRACLKKALEKRGLEWDHEKPPEDRWKGEPPSTIYPATLKALESWARGIIAYLDAERQPTATTEPRTMASEAPKVTLVDDEPEELEIPNIDFLFD